MSIFVDGVVETENGEGVSREIEIPSISDNEQNCRDSDEVDDDERL